MKRKGGKTKKGRPAPAPENAGAPPAPATRLWSAILLLALAAMVGVVLAALESVKEAAR